MLGPAKSVWYVYNELRHTTLTLTHTRLVESIGYYIILLYYIIIIIQDDSPKRAHPPCLDNECIQILIFETFKYTSVPTSYFQIFTILHYSSIVQLGDSNFFLNEIHHYFSSKFSIVYVPKIKFE